MNNSNYKNIDESQNMIVLGILSFYLLVAVFIIYLFVLHRISQPAAIISLIVFTLIYIPRFLILKKLKNKDNIKILDTSIKINNTEINFSDIENYLVEEKKPVVVFFMYFMYSKMVIFQEAIFYLKLPDGQISFMAIGSEKISLLKEFFNELLKNNGEYV